MDPVAVVITIACGLVAVSYIARTVVHAVVRLREGQRRAQDEELAARLTRIEHAVEATALEVERIGELMRFTARLQAPASPAAVVRHITPH